MDETSGPELAVCVYPVRQTGSVRQVLLGMKSRGRVAGWRVGPGGRVEDGEADEIAAIRELVEETGLSAAVGDLVHIATILVKFTGGSVRPTRVVVYELPVAVDSQIAGDGELTDFTWYDVGALPLDVIPPTDRLWLGDALTSQMRPSHWSFEMSPDYQAATLLSRRPDHHRP